VWTAPVTTGTNRELFYTILEASTKNVLVPATLISANDIMAPRVFAVGNYVTITYMNAATRHIFGVRWNSAAPLGGFAGLTDIATALANTSYDADNVTTDLFNFVLCYQSSDNLKINVVPAATLTISSSCAVLDAGLSGNSVIGVGV